MNHAAAEDAFTSKKITVLMPSTKINSRFAWSARLATMHFVAARGGWRIALRVASSALLVIALAYLYYAIFSPNARNADNASTLLEGMDFWNGNWILKGWVVPPNNFLTSDIALYGLVTAIAGFHPQVLYYSPALLWALAVVLGLGLSHRAGMGRPQLSALLIVLVFLGLPVSLSGMLSDSPIHIGTVAYMLGGFMLAGAYARGAARPRLILGAYAGVIAIGTFGDPMMIVLGALPIVATSLLYHFVGAGNHRRHGRLVLASIAAVVFAKAALALAHHYGGFSSPALDLGLVRLRNIGTNFYLGGRALLVLFGCEAGDNPSFLKVATVLARAAFALVVVAAVGKTAVALLAAVAQRWRKRAEPAATPPDYTNAVLLAGAAINTASFLTSRMVIDGGSTRYLIPGFVFAVILAARTVSGACAVTEPEPRRVLVFARRRFGHPLAVVCGAVAFALSVASVTGSTPVPRRPRCLPIRLRGRSRLGSKPHGKTDGFSQFWNSNIITVLSGGDVKVRALTGGDDPAPYLWHSKRAWYDADAVNSDTFFVLIRNEGADELDAQAVRRLFGVPIAVEQAGPFVVNTYRKDNDGLRWLADRIRPRPRVSGPGAIGPWYSLRRTYRAWTK